MAVWRFITLYPCFGARASIAGTCPSTSISPTNGLSAGQKAGIAVGVIAAVAMFAVVVILRLRRRKKKQYQPPIPEIQRAEPFWTPLVAGVSQRFTPSDSYKDGEQIGAGSNVDLEEEAFTHRDARYGVPAALDRYLQDLEDRERQQRPERERSFGKYLNHGTRKKADPVSGPEIPIVSMSRSLGLPVRDRLRLLSVFAMTQRVHQESAVFNTG